MDNLVLRVLRAVQRLGHVALKCISDIYLFVCLCVCVSVQAHVKWHVQAKASDSPCLLS